MIHCAVQLPVFLLLCLFLPISGITVAVVLFGAVLFLVAVWLSTGCATRLEKPCSSRSMRLSALTQTRSRRW